ncbi:hypothetical protein WJW32_12460 [Tepidibacter sp. Z1-5]
MRYMLKDKNKRLWVFTLINIVLLFLYLISSKVIKSYDLEFMDWVHNIPLINTISILITSIYRASLEKNHKHKEMILIITIIVSIVISVVAMFIRFLFCTTDHIVHKNEKTIVITVENTLLHTFVSFYERKFFILKKQIPGGGNFKGSYDPFERGEISY